MIDAEEMQHLAQLARLELTPEEREAMQNDLNTIMGYFEQLNEVNTDGIEEMQRPISLENVMREDVPGPLLSHEVVESLSSETQEGFIRVPRTVSND